ncbi:hypothetical protein [Sorangium sp. So ce887]|uniref:hypothetical protein n=1 Tax=Sorangium sp. So ce887 TaxID=3133324 RepID=UPI003F5FEAF0
MRAPCWPTAATAALAVTQAACSAPVTGELIVAIQTDMAVPKDLDHFDLQVLSGGKLVIANQRFPLGPEGVSLPATQGLTVSEDPGREISLRVRAILRGQVRVEHAVITTVPEDRVATLWAPLHFLCSMDEADDTKGVCPGDKTCFAGQCRDRLVRAELLPDYVEEDVLRRACFDVARCFGDAVPADVDLAGCTIAADGDVNVAIVTEGDGVCVGSGCFVPLDAESDAGARRTPEGRIALPEALCSPDSPAPLVVASPVTASCPRKQTGDPFCAGDEEQPVVLAARQRSPGSLAVSDDAVFWTEQGALSGPGDFKGDGAVKRVALAGGAPETLASGQAAPRQIALDRATGQVFWTNRGVGAAGSALMRWSAGVGDAAVVLDERSSGTTGLLEGLATDGEHLFFTLLPRNEVSGGVGQAALSGQMTEPVVDAGFPYRIAAADSVVCWTDQGVADTGAVWCSNDGLAGPVSVGDRENTPYGIALDPRDPAEVFWVNNFSGEVVRGAVDGGRREVLVEGCGGPYGIALDKHFVYWTNRGDGTVKGLPRGAAPGVGCGAEAVLTLAEGQRKPAAIAAFAGAIYWVNEGNEPPSGRADGAVVRRAKPPPP